MGGIKKGRRKEWEGLETRRKSRNEGRRGNNPESKHLVRAIVPPPPVASEDATSTSEEADEERNESTKRQPIGITVLSADPVIPKDIPGDPPKDHIDDPSDEGAKKGETRNKGHEYGA